MQRKLKIVLLILSLTIGTYGTYSYLASHKNIQSAKAFTTISVTDLVKEFIEQPEVANQKYMEGNTDSKVIIVTGTVQSIQVDQKGQKVVLLKEEGEKLGVSCTFMLETNDNADLHHNGDFVRIKGVLRSGAEYDEDLDLYEDAIVENCDIDRK